MPPIVHESALQRVCSKAPRGPVFLECLCTSGEGSHPRSPLQSVFLQVSTERAFVELKLNLLARACHADRKAIVKMQRFYRRGPLTMIQSER